MPELPEVQIVVNGLVENIVGSRIVDAKIQWPGYIVGIPPEKIFEIVSGQSVTRVDRRGKYILIFLDDSLLMVHLRMTGKILIQNTDKELPKHTHLVMYLDDNRCLAFNDVRKFGRLEVIDKNDINKRIADLNLGPEPFSKDFTADYLLKKFKNRKRSIKNTMLDQSIVAGLGNIYICEALLMACIDPFRPAGELSKAELVSLIKKIKTILKTALNRGGSSINDYLNVNGESGKMQNHFNVYGREGKPCGFCSSTIHRKRDIGRSTFWCPGCQK